MEEHQLDILKGAIDDTCASSISHIPSPDDDSGGEPVVLPTTTTLSELVAFLTRTKPRHSNAIVFEPQYRSLLWWSEYVLDGLFLRDRSLRYGCIEGETLVQGVHSFARRLSKRAEAETCRRLLTTIESLPLPTRVRLIDAYHNSDGTLAKASRTLVLRDIVLATRNAQAKSQYAAVQTQNLDDLVKLLNSSQAISAPPAAPPQTTLWLSESLRRSERALVLVGGPVRFYYAVLFAIGILLAVFAYLLRALLTLSK